MIFKQLVLILALASSTLMAQVLNNTYAKDNGVVIAQKSKRGATFTFSEANSSIPYCFMPFNYKSGSVELPIDKNGNQISAKCKFITDSEKNVNLDLKAGYESKKYDGVFFFSQSEMSKVSKCFQSKEVLEDIENTSCNDCQDLSQIRRQCINELKQVHILALRKKKKLNISTEDLMVKHINNSERDYESWGASTEDSGNSSSISNNIGSGLSM